MDKHRYTEVVVFVAGSTPQIITEALYALVKQAPEPVIPDELCIITTSSGKARIEEGLLRKGCFSSFCEEFGLRPDILSERSFIVIRDADDGPLDDIRTTGHNERAGDTIVNLIREKTSLMDTRLHCSIAGGRKTMSFYLGSALQLFGRPWDKLYHVLVTPEFESNPEFYYKPLRDREIIIRDDKGAVVKRLNTADAEIHLAELPFIRLRDKLRLNGKTFKELVLEGQKEIDTALTQPSIKVNIKERVATIGDKVMEFKPIHLVIYTHLLRQKVERCCYPDQPYCLECTDCFLQITDISNRRGMDAILKDYEKIYGPASGHVENFKRTWKDGMDTGKLRSDISKINKDIREALRDETLSTLYTITAVRKYANTRYGVKVERRKISIEE